MTTAYLSFVCLSVHAITTSTAYTVDVTSALPVCELLASEKPQREVLLCKVAQRSALQEASVC
jgi:hypothetical protein